MRYTELQISSELLDQMSFHGSPKKLIICSTPRSGSYLLCRHMINAGLGVPHEYFNPHVIRQMAPRFGLGEDVGKLTWPPRGRRDRLMLRKAQRAAEAEFLRSYMEILVSRRCQSGVFAAKIHFRDYARVLDNPLGRGLFDGAVFVHLYREDLLKQAVSEHVAQLTGKWGIDDTVTTTPHREPDFLNVEAINQAIADLSEQDRGWRMLLARRGVMPYSISYERLSKDPFPFVEALARALQVDGAALRRGYSEVDLHTESTVGMPTKSEILMNYLAATSASRTPPAIARGWSSAGRAAFGGLRKEPVPTDATTPN